MIIEGPSLDSAPVRNGLYVVGQPWSLRISCSILVLASLCFMAGMLREHDSYLGALLMPLVLLAPAAFGLWYCYRSRIEYDSDILVHYSTFGPPRRYNLADFVVLIDTWHGSKYATLSGDEITVSPIRPGGPDLIETLSKQVTERRYE